MKHIEITDFSAYFKLKKEYVVALDNVSLCVEAGEFVTLMGPSGCGKTTLLKCILGQIELTEGKLLLRGEEPSNDSIKNANIAYVAQNFSLYPHLSIYENIAFPLRMAEIPPEEVDEKVRAMAQKCGLPSALLNRKPRQLSVGQQQRVALARAFIKKPEIILMDEPFAHLDAPLRAEFQKWIYEYYAETHATFLFVTHDEEEARTLGGRLLYMEDGKILSSEDTSRYGKCMQRESPAQKLDNMQKEKTIRTKGTFRNRLLYRWPLYLLVLVALTFVLSTVWERLAAINMNQKLSVCFVGKNFRDADVQERLSQEMHVFTEQALKNLTVESLYYDNGSLLAEALTVRCVGETDFMILEEDYLVDEIGSRYFCKIPAELVQKYFPGAKTYTEDNNIYGIRIYSQEEEEESSIFSEYYDGDNSCWLFFTIVSENVDAMNGKGVGGDTAALDLAAYLWREHP